MGVLSALPLISAGNFCCCLWVVSGGVVAAYLLQENQASPITAADGALVGLLAGLLGAVFFLVLSIPISMVMAPVERAMVQRILERWPDLPIEMRDAMNTVGTGVRVGASFVMMLCAGAFFSTLGGLLGVAMFQKPSSGIIDVTPPPPSH